LCALVDLAGGAGEEVVAWVYRPPVPEPSLEFARRPLVINMTYEKNGYRHCGRCGCKSTWAGKSRCYECNAWLGIAPAKPKQPQGAWKSRKTGTGQANGEWQDARSAKWRQPPNKKGDGGSAKAVQAIARDDALKDRPETAAFLNMVDDVKQQKKDSQPVHVRARTAQQKVTKKLDQARRCEERMAGLSEQREKIDIQLAQEQDALYTMEADLVRLRAECNAFDDMPSAKSDGGSFEDYLGSNIGPNVTPELAVMLQAIVKMYETIVEKTFIKPAADEDDDHMGESGQSEGEEEADAPATPVAKRSVWLGEITTQELEDEHATIIYEASVAQSKESSAVAARIARIEASEQRVSRSRMLDAAKKIDVVETDDEGELRGRSRDKSKSRSPKGKPAEIGQRPVGLKPLTLGPKMPGGN
jgi:hypothetical protein